MTPSQVYQQLALSPFLAFPRFTACTVAMHSQRWLNGLASYCQPWEVAVSPSHPFMYAIKRKLSAGVHWIKHTIAHVYNCKMPMHETSRKYTFLYNYF